MRVTKNRERVIGALLTAEKPLNAEEIRERGDLDLVTVYRNVEAFEQAGVLQRIPLENGTQIFELTAPDEYAHPGGPKTVSPEGRAADTKDVPPRPSEDADRLAAG